MSEIEHQEAELQNFIMEITKLKESHPSLFAVENINDLGLEESRVWEEYKLLFKKTDNELSKSDAPQKDVLDQLMVEVDTLVKLIRKSKAGIKNNNRVEFFAWMNNRLGVLVNNLDYLQTEGEEDGVLQKVKDSLSREKKNLLF